jgi:hypothetical protein
MQYQSGIWQNKKSDNVQLPVTAAAVVEAVNPDP